MTNKLKTIFILSTVVISILTISSCNKDEEDKETASATDKELYEMAKITSDFTWYKNSNSLLNRSAGSGHSPPFLRTRYNSIAASKLTSTGQVMTNATFPEGSLIVKELHNTTTLERYAILYKNSGSADADSKGWVWGYINADGSIEEPASKKGISCFSCHSQADNIDYMLMNKYFP